MTRFGPPLGSLGRRLTLRLARPDQLLPGSEPAPYPVTRLVEHLFGLPERLGRAV
jgi:hypothetical protein